MPMFIKFTLSLIFSLFKNIFSLQSNYINLVLSLLKKNGGQSFFFKVILCIIYSLPLAILYGLIGCFLRSILYAFFAMGLNWLDNWYVYFCLQFPNVKKRMLFYSYIVYSDYFYILLNPVDYKQLFFLMVIKVVASFSSRIFLLVWLSCSFNFFWKGVLQFPSYMQLLIIILVKFILFFKTKLVSRDNSPLLFFILLTHLMFLLIISVIFILLIFFKNLSSNPEDYEEFLKLAKFLNDEKSNSTKE